jgi:hypothetical protein
VTAGAVTPLATATGYAPGDPRACGPVARRDAAAALANMAMHHSARLVMVAPGSGVFRSLATLARSGDDLSESAAARAAANLAESVEPGIHGPLLNADLMNAFLRLADTGTILSQREVARFFALLACSLSTHAALLSAGAVAYAIRFLGSDDAACAKHGALAVANLAVSHASHGALMSSSECAAALGRASTSPDRDVRRCIAFGCCNLASNERIHDDMLRWSLVRVLVMLLATSVACDDDYATVQCAFAIRWLGLHAACRVAAVAAGVLQPLLLLVASTETPMATLREVMTTLRNLSFDDGNKLAMVAAGALRVIPQCSRRGDTELAHQSLGVLANLAEVLINQRQMIAEGTLQDMKYFLTLADARTTAAAAAAAAPPNSGAIVYAAVAASGAGAGSAKKKKKKGATEAAAEADAAGGGDTVSAIVARSDAEHVEPAVEDGAAVEACRALANLATEFKHTAELVSGGALSCLVDAMRPSASQLRRRYGAMALSGLAMNPSLCVRIVAEGSVPLLVSLAKRDSEDTAAQRYAVMAMANLAMSRASHEALIDATAVRIAVQLLGCEDGDVAGAATTVIVNFAVAPENHALLGSEHVLPVLVRLCHGSDGAAAARHASADADEVVVLSAAMTARRAQALATRGLRGFAVDARMRTQIVLMGGLHALLRLAATGGSAAGATDVLSSPASVQADALAALTNLAISGCIADYAQDFAVATPVPLLCDFLESTDARKVCLVGCVVCLARKCAMTLSRVPAAAVRGHRARQPRGAPRMRRRNIDELAGRTWRDRVSRPGRRRGGCGRLRP